jgi:O-antigen/teichoic acid export membrane protein
MRVVSQVFAAKAVDYAIKFAISVLIARALGPSDKGVLSFAMLVFGWTVTFGNLGIMDANTFLTGSRRYRADDAILPSVAVSLLLGIIYAVVLFVLVSWQIVRWPVGRPTTLYLLLAAIPFSLLANNALGILQGLSRFIAYNVFTIAGSMLFLLAIGAVMWFAQDRLIGIAGALLVTTVLHAVLLAGYLPVLARQRLGFPRAYLKEAIWFGLRGHLRVVLAHITVRFDQFVLGAMLKPEYLGWYSVAVALSEGLQMLPVSVGMVLFPQVAAQPATAGESTARACRQTLLIMVAGAGIVALIARPVVSTLFGAAFLPSTQPLYVLLVAVVFQAASRVLWNYFAGMGRPQLTLCSTGVAALTTLSLIFPMVRHYGMMGAAFTSLLAHGIGATVDVLLAKKVSGTAAHGFVVLQKSDLQLAAWLRS